MEQNDDPCATDKNARVYQCQKCGTMRSEAEGGTVFTVCDDCWDKHFKKEPSNA